MSSGPISATVEIDGARLYTEWRTPAVAGRPVLVFLHDGLGCCAGWRDFLDILVQKTGLGAFAYDRWGYGRSDVRETFPADFAEDAARHLPLVLAAMGITDHIVVGHSDGASIALLHATNNPDGLRCVVSIGAHVQNDTSAYAQLLRHQRFVDEERRPDGITAFHGARASSDEELGCCLACGVRRWLGPGRYHDQYPRAAACAAWRRRRIRPAGAALIHYQVGTRRGSAAARRAWPFRPF